MAKLGEVCKVSASTKMIDKSKAWLLNLDMVEQQTGRVVEYNFVGEDGLKGSITQFDTENVLYSKLRPNLNKVVLPERNGFCTSELLPLRPDARKLDRSYLAVFLRSDGFVNWAVSKTAGAKMPRLGTKDLLNANIPLPEIKEQKAIAEKFKKSEELISLRKQQLVKMDELVKARFFEMFGDPVNNPMNYPKSQLGKVCDVRDGTHDSPEYYDVGYPLVTSKNVTGGKIDLSECNLISEDDYKKICERSKVDRGDIIMPMIGTVGKPVIVNIEPMFAIKNVALIKFTPNSLVINIYIKTLLESDYFDRAVLDKIRGGTQKFIALGDIRKLEIILPDLKHQQCFSAFVERVNQQKQTVQQSLEKLELMKKALMQEYFG